MEWILVEAYCAMFYGSTRSKTERYAETTPTATETDMWITRQAYEFAAANETCEKCGAGFSRRLSLATVYDPHERYEAPWRIGVVARCRGWRRHRHSALVTEARDGLRFEPLRPD